MAKFNRKVPQSLDLHAKDMFKVKEKVPQFMVIVSLGGKVDGSWA